ncbi:AraC family transcriptional regulator [Flavobacterium sp.]|uniref:helix-turn-helix domain-containing protein n=1 Tax=Flavobacterium sp. TaxID=239 RepID=UPI002BBD32CE|nr:AraC family transcriptional regulator [Flavobacterium sp.]HSD06093.1 AraC family transcriptional regulator [Flavobacterium sp.]
MLELTVKETSGFLSAFAELIGGELQNGILKIPESKGKGYLRGFRLHNTIEMFISNYEFNDSLFAKRFGNQSSLKKVLFSFNNIFPDTDSSNKVSTVDLPSIQIFKGKLSTETLYPGKTKFRSIFIGIDSLQLKQYLGQNEENEVFNTLINNEHPILFEEIVLPKIQEVALEIIESDIPDYLSDFFFKIKAEELICLTLKELFKRENATVQALNEMDVQKIYQVRDRVLAEIHTPPVIKDLAELTGMSESKFKRLFKQIFGNSFFNYYQKFRMKEAARLLKENKMTVSEVGYSLGFSNLSHFAKAFEQHIGMKPKTFQRNR